MLTQGASWRILWFSSNRRNTQTFAAISQSKSPLAGGAVSQCIPSFEPFLWLCQEHVPCALFSLIANLINIAWPIETFEWLSADGLLRAREYYATMEDFAYKSGWIKLSTGVCINYPQGLWIEKFLKFHRIFWAVKYRKIGCSKFLRNPWPMFYR